MSFRRTIFLAVTLVLLAVASYYLKVTGPREHQQIEEAEAHLLRLEPAQVTSIELRRGEERIALRKEAGAWKMTEPISTAGDEDAVQYLLERLQELKQERVVSDEAVLGDFGLRPSKLSVHVEMGGEKGVLHLGDDNPTGSGVYASVDESSQVFLLEAGARERLGRSRYDLRDKELLKISRPQVRHLVIERSGERIALKKGEEGWELTVPVKTLADADVVDRTLDAFLRGKAQSFPEEDPRDLEQYGLAPPDIRLTFAKEAGKEPVIFLIGKPAEDGYYARRGTSGPVFTLERWRVEDLPKETLEVRDRKIFDFEKEAVVQVEIQGPDGEVVAKKKEDEWRIEGPDTLKGSEQRISDLLWDIKFAKIAGFFDDPAERPDPKVLADPTRRISLTVEGKEDPLRFFIGQQVAGQENWYAKRATDEEIFLLSSDTVELVTKTVFDLQE